MTYRRKLGALCLALAAFVGVSLDWDHGDLRYGVAGRTLRHWDVVPSLVPFRSACAGGFVHSGGGPCNLGGATTYTFTGPTTGGKINVASTNFTVQPVGTLSASVVITPHDTAGGIFTPTSVTMAGAGSATFTYTPLQIGTYNLTVTNSDSLTNPAAVKVTETANISNGYPGFVSGWSTDATSLTTGVAGDPFGGSNAASLTEAAQNNQHRLSSTACVTITSGQTYTFSVMIKQSVGTRNTDVNLRSCDSLSAFGADINTSTGAVVDSYSYGTASAPTVTVSSTGLASGWFLVQITGAINGGYTSVFNELEMDPGDFVNPYLGDGVSTILISRPSLQ